MSSLLFRQVTVCDPRSSFNNQVKDVLVIDGTITSIENSIPLNNHVIIEGAGFCLMPSFIDIGTWVGEPGQEDREDFHSATKAALAGGYSHLVIMPSTNPAIDNKSSVEFVNNQNQVIQFSVLGAISKQLKGEQMAELYDMHTAGAMAFCESNKGLANEGLLLRAMQYVKAFNGLIVQQPDTPALSKGGMMHEGKTHITLGLKGVPALAEHLAVKRDIELCKYADSRIHFLNCTTTEGLKQVKQAINDGIKVSASVSSLYLLLTDESLTEFDSNFKLFPPLRDQPNVESIKESILNGTVSIIISGHTPRTIEEKAVEFAYASNGSINLETCLSALITAFDNQISNDKIVELMSHNPRKLLGIDINPIEVGQKVDLTLIDRQQSTLFTHSDIKSKSKNSALLGKQLQGKVKGVFTKNVWHQN